MCECHYVRNRLRVTLHWNIIRAFISVAFKTYQITYAAILCCSKINSEPSCFFYFKPVLIRFNVCTNCNCILQIKPSLSYPKFFICEAEIIIALNYGRGDNFSIKWHRLYRTDTILWLLCIGISSVYQLVIVGCWTQNKWKIWSKAINVTAYKSKNCVIIAINYLEEKNSTKHLYWPWTISRSTDFFKGDFFKLRLFLASDDIGL